MYKKSFPESQFYSPESIFAKNNVVYSLILIILLILKYGKGFLVILNFLKHCLQNSTGNR